MLRKVRIRIVTDRVESHERLFDPMQAAPGPSTREEKPEHLEMTVEGRYHDDGDRVSISYHESELTGMAGSTTTVSFRKNEQGLISMLRHGTVKTALVFEAKRRHVCVYETPVMPFEVCVYTRSVTNALEREGRLTMDYTVELRGAQAEKTRFSLTLLPDFDRPQTK